MSRYNKHTWNYRIATKLFSYKKEFEGKNEKMSEFPDERLFYVIEVYYQKDSKIPDSYVERDPINALTSIKDIKWTLKKIKKALKKPIIDLDNWPNEYTIDETQIFQNKFH